MTVTSVRRQRSIAGMNWHACAFIEAGLWRAVTLLIGTWFVVFPLVGYAAVPSLLVNGDFSAGRSGWWGDTSNIVPHGTGMALRLSSGFAAQDRIAIEAGRHYHVRLAIRTVNAPVGAAFVQISFRGDNVDKRWRGNERIVQPWGTEAAAVVAQGREGVWQTYDAVLAAPSQASQMLIYLRKMQGTSGVAEFSDVSVTPTDEPVTGADDLQSVRLHATLFPPALPEAERNSRLAAIVKSAGTPAARLLLAEHGIARYHVHVGTSADAMTLHAATELADYLKQITGADVAPISTDDAPQSGPLLVVGSGNRLATALCRNADRNALGQDGFIFCTSGPNLVVEGLTSRGTMYGVNWLLDRVLGVKWLAPDATYVPLRATLSIPALNERHVPRFAYREILSNEGQDRAFRAHNLLNGESHGPSFSASPAALDNWDHSWLAKDGDASFWDLLPRQVYAKDHPEWYAGGQIAMMDPAVRRILAGNVIARLRRLPDYTKVWFGIHDMDWGWDMDAASRAFAEKHGGSPSAPLLDMVTDVAAQVREVMPGARLAFNAYHWGFAPPVGMTMPDYVLVYPMTIQVDYSTPLDTGRNEALGKALAGWNAIAPHMFVWDHITNFGGFIQPTPNIYPIGESIQWLAALKHVSGYFAEGSWNTPGAEFASLRVWMMARLLWNPDQDVRALVAEYCDNYFGAASPYVVAYINLMHATLARSGDLLGEQTPVGMAMYSRDFVASADKLLAQAERAVSEDSVLTARVRQARIPLDYVILVRRNEYNVLPTGSSWQVNHATRLQRFEASLKAAHVRMFRQGADMAALEELLAIERWPAKPPAEVVNLSQADWQDFQDVDLNLYGGAHIVADASASDGAAVLIKGNSFNWAVQFKFDNLPRTAAWDLYVVLRVHASGKTDHPGGVRVGSFPPMDCFTEVSSEALSGARYQVVLVPGGPFSYGTNHDQGAYVQADRLDADDQLLVDRFFVVRHGSTLK
jgi:hypothetical protein